MPPGEGGRVRLHDRLRGEALGSDADQHDVVEARVARLGDQAVHLVQQAAGGERQVEPAEPAVVDRAPAPQPGVLRGQRAGDAAAHEVVPRLQRRVEHVAARWNGVEVVPPVSERFGVPVFLDNEVNAAALGEHQAHPGVRDLLFVKISTGIGAGLIAGGRIQRGALGAAGEIGHVPVPDGGGHPCRCGNLDCVEAVAGGTALLARSPAADLPGLAALARSGDAATVALLRDAGRRIGEVVATAVNLLNPAVVVLGGDLIGADEPLIAGLREAVYQRSTVLATRTLRIEPSRLGESAGLTGCAAMVLDRILAPETLDTAP
ncbi:ROK family protein [Actinomadura rubrisoli]|uniref:ROK family protein n=1 Tax=Actinomadura rubrisoli TaxID=2530368 RepID=A0A4R5BC91_9ACTN|nr:ROK family protein [Actinomadura rubrisoli]